MVSTAIRNKITFTRRKSGDLEISRNGVREVSIKGASQQLEKHLKSVIYQERDYEEFLKFFGLPPSTHLGSWMINYLSHADREILDEFKKVVATPK